MSSVTAFVSSCSSSVSHHSKNNYIHGHHNHHSNVHKTSSISTGLLPLMKLNSIHKSFNLGSSSSILRPQTKRAMNIRGLNAIENLQQGEQILSSTSPSDLFHFSLGWSNWFLWTLIPMILSFTKNKWAPLLTLKKEVDKAMDTVESVAEIMEEVALKVDKLAEEVGDKLPEGSKLKDVVHTIEKAAEQTVKCADLAEDLIHKFEEIEKRVEDIIDRPDGGVGRAAVVDQEKVVS